MANKRNKKKKYRVHTKEQVWCSVCKTNSVMSTSDVLEIICGDCVAWELYREELQERSVEKEDKLAKSKYPRGWHRRKLYVAPDGVEYTFGKKITGEKRAINSKKSSKKTGPVRRNSSRNN